MRRKGNPIPYEQPRNRRAPSGKQKARNTPRRKRQRERELKNLHKRYARCLVAELIWKIYYINSGVEVRVYPFGVSVVTSAVAP